MIPPSNESTGDESANRDGTRRYRPPSAASRLRQLMGGGGEGLESAAGTEAELSPDRIVLSLDMLQEVLAREVVENRSTRLGQEAADALLTEARIGLERLAKDGPEADLSVANHVGLEAIIETDGSRPSVPVRNGTIDRNDPRLRGWATHLALFSHAVKKACAATGRIVVNGDLSESSVNGTAVMVAPGLAATAKHVVEQTFEPNPDGSNTWFKRYGEDLTLDFQVEVDRPPNANERVKIRGIHWASSDQIGHTLKIGNLDLALLSLETEGPPPIVLASDLPRTQGQARLHIIGHPKRALPPSLEEAKEFSEILALVFGDGFGVKRWSPGFIQIGPGHLSGDTSNARVMTHDASTLAGNSGSPVFDLNNVGDSMIGLHYGGFFEKENYAHGGANFAAILAEAIAWPGTSDGNV